MIFFQGSPSQHQSLAWMPPSILHWIAADSLAGLFDENLWLRAADPKRADY
jgi:hypothetical protein